MNFIRKFQFLGVAMVLSFSALTVSHAAPGERAHSVRTQKVIDFWSKERVGRAQPRDLIIDERGHAYLRTADGSKRFYGRSARAESRIVPKMGRPRPPGRRPIGSGTVRNSSWDFGGDIQTAAGRLFFEMGDELFVCSGTVAEDGIAGRSVIITAAHCVYDDENKIFASNILFIPNQAGTTGFRTDANCDNDPLGCWAPAFSIVDVSWTSNEFPDNARSDYAYLVVSDTGTHSGNGDDGALDEIAGALSVDFLPPYVADGDRGPDSLDFTYALGYSGTDDPNFMYCAEDMGSFGPDNWWLRSCGLTHGSSGGPWVQPMDKTTGNGSIISVNSWGLDTGGMAGPLLSDTNAECLFDVAKTTSLDSEEDVVVTPSTCP